MSKRNFIALTLISWTLMVMGLVSTYIALGQDDPAAAQTETLLPTFTPSPTLVEVIATEMVPTQIPPTAVPTEVPPTAVPTEIPPTEIIPTDVPQVLPTDIVPTDVPQVLPTDIVPTEVPQVATHRHRPDRRATGATH